MKIAVVGCAHGELEKIYDTIEFIKKQESISVDLLLCCGDFESVRSPNDLESMAVPPKYRTMGSFYKYFTGEKTAPILTVFVGGNHEASSYLQELPYGGWVASNIYYMGYASVINIGGLKIGGISGIYKSHDYKKGHFEFPPYTEDTKRSVYHIREFEVFRLKNYSKKLDIFLSHDWPTGVWNFGNVNKLLTRKPAFQRDISTNCLGAIPLEELLEELKPRYWFAAHLHCKFPAVIPHYDENKSVTKFLALDKCLPRRHFLQIIDIAHDSDKSIEINYDPEWLAILCLTNNLLNITRKESVLPYAYSSSRWDFKPTEHEIEEVNEKMNRNFIIDKNFDSNNLLTKDLCYRLKIDNPLCLLRNLHEFEQNESINESKVLDDNERPSFIESIDLSDVMFDHEDDKEMTGTVNDEIGKEDILPPMKKLKGINEDISSGSDNNK